MQRCFSYCLQGTVFLVVVDHRTKMNWLLSNFIQGCYFLFTMHAQSSIRNVQTTKAYMIASYNVWGTDLNNAWSKRLFLVFLLN